MLWSSQAAAQTAKEERERHDAAEHVTTIATAYVLGASRSYPIMQLDLKENIQNATNGKIYVTLAPDGQLGAGGSLVQKVQGGTIQAAQHSLSNLAPFASVVDLINMPYLCGSNQRITNLVTSDHWQTEVHPKVEAAGFKALFYVNIDPRVVAVRYAFIYLVRIGAAAAVRDRAHLRIDVVLHYLGPRKKALPYIFGDLVMVAVAVIALYWSWETVHVSAKFGSVSHGLRISMAWFLMAVPIGFALMLRRLAQSLLRDQRALRDDPRPRRRQDV